MATKSKKVYVCSNCGYQANQWVGQCSSCGLWNTLQEEVLQPVIHGGKESSGGFSSRVAPVRLSEVMASPVTRVSSNIAEFDRVLGGGFVPGQVILLTGDPGIGKSTLLTEISKKLGDRKVLYVCGEESIDQIKLRATRMKYDAKNLIAYAETNVEGVVGEMQSQKDLSLVIVDSIQSVYSDEFVGISGAVSQIRGCTQILTNAAKNTGIPMILIGHVTKEGSVAGPKILEHIVDTVLSLEGDTQHMYRLLRTSKNRFGPISEVGIFEMVESGMAEVKNPSEMFLEERLEKSPGSCVTVVMEGFRPILFEVQALTVKTDFGYPRRTTSGFNANRLQVLIAILQKRCGLDLSGHDVYVSIAGGFKVTEYAADLAVCLAIASALKEKPLKGGLASFGECGLSGEVRKVSYQDKRLKEAKKLGYDKVVGPAEVKSVSQALRAAFS